MLKIETRWTLSQDLLDSPNLVGKVSAEDLAKIGDWVWKGWDRDEFSRTKWKKRMTAAMDLAMQVSEGKSFPWQNCSNIKFPLVTIAAMQFHSRAYPAIVQGTDVVRYRVIGDDPSGKERDRATRVGKHMSYQLLEEDSGWEEGHDRMLLNIPIVGCAFKKSHHSKGANVSELVLAQDLVMDYYARSVESCGRKTHVYPMYRNEVYEAVHEGRFADCLDEEWFTQAAVPLVNNPVVHADQRKGQTPPPADENTPFTILEQHCFIDFDGDGYAEPYIVTIEHRSKTVLRIVTGVDDMRNVVKDEKGRILRIEAVQYFTKYGFIPAPDGGVYDIGFGILLGPLNESVDTLINQLVDAGTMNITAGGFLARGVKIRGGEYKFAPLEWKRVETSGDDLRKGIFPYPTREPSQVLFSLLTLLINYTNRISGATDTLAGENPGQNTPAETTQTMVEQGMKIYSSIFKRVWKSMKEEFKKLYLLNRTFLPEKTPFGEQGGYVLREDYLGDPKRIVPVADPNAVSARQRLQKAMMVKQMATTTPGYDLAAVERNFLQAAEIEGWESLYPGPDKVPPLPNPKVMVENLKTQRAQLELKAQREEFLISLMEERRINNAKILELEARAAEHLANAKGVEVGHQLSAMQTALGALKSHDESLRKRVEIMVKAMESDREFERDQQAATQPGGMGGLAAASSHKGAAPGPAGAH